MLLLTRVVAGSMSETDTAQATCPVCEDFEGHPDSVEQHITGSQDEDHSGENGPDWRGEIVERAGSAAASAASKAKDAAKSAAESTGDGDEEELEEEEMGTLAALVFLLVLVWVLSGD